MHRVEPAVHVRAGITAPTNRSTAARAPAVRPIRAFDVTGGGFHGFVKMLLWTVGKLNDGGTPAAGYAAR